MSTEEDLTVPAEDGIGLHIRRRSGGGPAVVFCHGGTGSGQAWNELIPYLPEDWDVITPDARGHGQSGRASKYTWSDMAADIVRTADALELRRFALVGHSMGAAAVAACAIHHQVGSCVVLVDPPWWPNATVSERREKAQNWRKGIESSHRMTEEEHEVKLRQDWMSDSVVKRRVASERAVDPAILDPDFFETIRDWREVGELLPTPTLLVTGDSGIVTAEQATEMQRLNERIAVANIENTGHALVEQSPARLAQEITPFISEHL